jgi:hypothetical protein
MSNEEEPRDPEEESGESEEEELSQDLHVERLRPDPSEPPTPVRVLQGLMGNSDREGYRRLYFNRELNSYAEFRQEEVVFSEPIPPEQHPFVGLDATRVGIRRDAAIEYTRVSAPRPVDEFDLDVRIRDPTRRTPRLKPATWPDATACGGATCGEFTCEGATTCGEFTCEVTCGCPPTVATCARCQPTVGDATCESCATCGLGVATCFGHTCGEEISCADWATCITCGGTCGLNFGCH